MAEAEPAAKRPREEAASPEAITNVAAANVAEAAGTSAGGACDDDDDDDSDVDLSAYDMVGDDKPAEDVCMQFAPTLTMTREEQLLKREQEEETLSKGGRLDGGRRRAGRKVFIDDSKGSFELSLGGERAKDRRKAAEMAAHCGISAFAPG